MPVRQTDESGELVYGYFYQLNLVRKSETCLNETSKWIVSDFEPPGGKQVVGAECAYAEVVSFEQRDRHDCPVDKTHVSCQVIIPTLVDLFSGPEAPFIPNFSDGLVSERLAEQLRASPLKNVEIHPVELTEDPRGPQPKVFALIFSGPEICRLGWSGPEADNSCPFCHFKPLFCTGCRSGTFFCPKCGKDCIVLEREFTPGDPRIVLKPTPALGEIVDPRLWDGSDFCGGSCGTITRRALDWLLSVHAAPFRAQPLRTNISGLTAEQRRFLETANEPVKGK
jgi:hypothetical protein